MSEIDALLSDDDVQTFFAALRCPVTYVCPHRDRAIDKDEAHRRIYLHIKALRALAEQTERELAAELDPVQNAVRVARQATEKDE